jgi:hypothetical protein
MYLALGTVQQQLLDDSGLHVEKELGTKRIGEWTEGRTVASSSLFASPLAGRCDRSVIHVSRKPDRIVRVCECVIREQDRYMEM